MVELSPRKPCPSPFSTRANFKSLVPSLLLTVTSPLLPCTSISAGSLSPLSLRRRGGQHLGKTLHTLTIQPQNLFPKQRRWFCTTSVKGPILLPLSCRALSFLISLFLPRSNFRYRVTIHAYGRPHRWRHYRGLMCRRRGLGTCGTQRTEGATVSSQQQLNADRKAAVVFWG